MCVRARARVCVCVKLSSTLCWVGYIAGWGSPSSLHTSASLKLFIVTSNCAHFVFYPAWNVLCCCMMESSYALPVINYMAKIVDFYSRFSIIDEYNSNSTKTNLTNIFLLWALLNNSMKDRVFSIAIVTLFLSIYIYKHNVYLLWCYVVFLILYFPCSSFASYLYLICDIFRTIYLTTASKDLRR